MLISVGSFLARGGSLRSRFARSPRSPLPRVFATWQPCDSPWPYAPAPPDTTGLREDRAGFVMSCGESGSWQKHETFPVAIPRSIGDVTERQRQSVVRPGRLLVRD